MTKMQKAGYKAWETRRKNAAKNSESTVKKTAKVAKKVVKRVAKTFKKMENVTPRILIYDIPTGAKRVKVLPGYQKVEFTK